VKKFILFFSVLLCGSLLNSQDIKFEPEDFATTGDAVALEDRCFRLTEPILWQGGGVWYRKPIDLRKAFEMEIDVGFGCDDNGADGIVFIFHPELTTGFQGEGMGFGGLYYPSFGIEMDTYKNMHLGDPWYDHVAFMQNGHVHHETGITQPSPLVDGRKNVEDCQRHRVKIQWNPDTHIVEFYFDGSLRVKEEIRLVEDLFLNDPIVYWGFTSATGGKVNTHLVCLESLKFSTVNTFSKSIRELILEGEKYVLKDIDFTPGSTRLPKGSTQELDKLLLMLKENPEYTVFLNGFTDSSGDATRNLLLSQKRAASIADFLKQNGIQPGRVRFHGYGEDHPIAPNDTTEGQKQNRRIEIIMKILRV
jgi:outer membrane protein OmpA-like peptidoglycan-associated protein